MFIVHIYIETQFKPISITIANIADKYIPA